MSIFNIQKWMGHSDPRMTMEHYAHLSPEYDEDINGAPPVRVERNPERPPTFCFATRSIGGVEGPISCGGGGRGSERGVSMTR